MPTLRSRHINSLPPEIFTEIFECGKAIKEWSDIESGSVDVPSTPDFQVLASHICQTWRRLALKSQKLWTDIVLLHGPPYRNDKPRTYIERSGSIDVNISICERGDDFRGTPIEDKVVDELHTFMRIVQNHVTRWRQLTVILDSHDDFQLVLDYLRRVGPAPRLVSLTLGNCLDRNSHVPAGPSSEITIFNNHAPLLTNVLLADAAFTKVNFLQGLTYLNLSYHNNPHLKPTSRELVSLILSSPDLEELGLSDSSLFPFILSPEGWPKEVIVLKSLTDISLDIFTPMHAKIFLNRLRIPQLKALTLGLIWDSDDTIVANELYSTFSSLSCLALTSITYSNPFITTLQDPKLLPNLQELAIEATDDKSDELESVVLCRFDADKGLCELTLKKGMINQVSLEVLEKYVGSINIVDDF